VAVIVTVTGTGTPIPAPGRAGPGVLVSSGETRLQFDAGRATVTRLAEAGVSPTELSALFVTHHHSDHIMDVADIVLTRWIQGRTDALAVVVPDGPAGAMMDRLLSFWQEDIDTRTGYNRTLSAPQVDVRRFTARESRQPVWSDGSVVVSAVLAHHEPVVPAVAYRVDGPDGSVTISGDTTVCPAVVGLAAGSDVVVHEAVRSRLVLGKGRDFIASYHADTVQLGKAFGALHGPDKIGTLVLTHMVPPPSDTAEEQAFADEVRSGGFDGPVIVARDGLRVDRNGVLA